MRSTDDLVNISGFSWLYSQINKKKRRKTPRRGERQLNGMQPCLTS